MKLRFVYLPLAAALALPPAVWAQASGESAAVAVPQASPDLAVQPEPDAQVAAGQVSEAQAQRSALWTSVEAQHRGGAAQALEQGRRLTPAQLRELREQVRQAWNVHEADQATASAADRVGVQP